MNGCHYTLRRQRKEKRKEQQILFRMGRPVRVRACVRVCECARPRVCGMTSGNKEEQPLSFSLCVLSSSSSSSQILPRSPARPSCPPGWLHHSVRSLGGDVKEVRGMCVCVRHERDRKWPCPLHGMVVFVTGASWSLFSFFLALSLVRGYSSARLDGPLPPRGPFGLFDGPQVSCEISGADDG